MTLKNPVWDSLIRLPKTVFYQDGLLKNGHTKDIFCPKKTMRVDWDSTALMLRRLTGSIKVEKSSFRRFSRINLPLVF
jgi:hypothetical protein